MTRKIPQFIEHLIENLPEMLIEERRRLGLTQKQVADKLGMKEQQIQRYEATHYQSANLKRIHEIAKAIFELEVD